MLTNQNSGAASCLNVDACHLSGHPTPEVAEGRGNVDKFNAYAFYDVLDNLRKIVELPNEPNMEAAIGLVRAALASVEALLHQNEPLPVVLAKGAAEILHYQLRRFTTAYAADPNAPDGRRFESNLITDFRYYHSIFDAVFRAEIATVATFYVPRRGMFVTEHLINGAHESFPVGLRDKISDRTRLEWGAAGRCLGFGLWSACGLHVARAVECVVEEYYRTFVGDFPKPKMVWGDYVDGLRKKERPEGVPFKKTVTAFDQMREWYRNPLMHPTIVLDEVDARALFNDGESLIISMTAEIAKAQAG